MANELELKLSLANTATQGLQQGQESVQQFGQQVAQSGDQAAQAFSHVTTASAAMGTQTAASLQGADAAAQQLGTSVDGAAQAISDSTTTAAASFDQIATAASASGSSAAAGLADIGTAAQSLGTDVAASAEQAAAGLTGLADESATAAGSIAEVGTSSDAAAGSLGTEADAADGLRDKVDRSNQSHKDHAESSGHLDEVSKTLAGTLAEQGVPMGELTERWGQLKEGMAKVSSEEENTGHGLQLLTAGLVGLEAIGISKAVEGFVELGDQVHEISEVTGTSAPTVQGFGYALQTIGQSSDAAQKPLMILERNAGTLTDQLASGTVPSGKFADALDKIGISAQAFVEMNPDQRIRAIMDGFKGLGEEANKTQIAMDLFGRSGASMIGVLDQGSAAIDTGIAKVNQYGAGMDDAWPKVQQFHTAQANLTTAMQGFEVQLGSAVLPTVSGFVDGVASAVGVVDQLPAPVKEAGAGAIILGTGVLGATVAFQAFAPAVEEAAVSLGTFAMANPEVLALAVGLAGVVLVTEHFSQAEGESASAVKGATTALAGKNSELQKNVDLIRQQSSGSADYLSTLQAQAGAADAKYKELSATQEAMFQAMAQQSTRDDGSVDQKKLANLERLNGAYLDVKSKAADAATAAVDYSRAADAEAASEKQAADMAAAVALQHAKLAGDANANVLPTLGLLVHAIDAVGVAYNASKPPDMTPAQVAAKGLTDELEKTRKAYEDAKSAQDALFNQPTGQQEQNRAQLQLLNAELSSEQERLTQLNPKSAEYASIQNDITTRLTPAIAAQQSWNKATDDTRSAYDTLTKAYQSGNLTLDQYNSKVAELQKAMGPLPATFADDAAAVQKTNDAHQVAIDKTAAFLSAKDDEKQAWLAVKTEGIDPATAAMDNAANRAAEDGPAIGHATDPVPGIVSANMNQIDGIVGSAITNATGTAASQSPAIGDAIGAGINAGMGRWVGTLINTAVGLVASAVAAAKAQAEAHSPSELAAREVGEPLTQGIILGAMRLGPQLNAAMQTLVGGAVSAGAGAGLGTGMPSGASLKVIGQVIADAAGLGAGGSSAGLSGTGSMFMVRPEDVITATRQRGEGAPSTGLGGAGLGVAPVTVVNLPDALDHAFAPVGAGLDALGKATQAHTAAVAALNLPGGIADAGPQLTQAGVQLADAGQLHRDAATGLKTAGDGLHEVIRAQQTSGERLTGAAVDLSTSAGALTTAAAIVATTASGANSNPAQGSGNGGAYGSTAQGASFFYGGGGGGAGGGPGSPSYAGEFAHGMLSAAGMTAPSSAEYVMIQQLLSQNQTVGGMLAGHPLILNIDGQPVRGVIQNMLGQWLDAQGHAAAG